MLVALRFAMQLSCLYAGEDYLSHPLATNSCIPSSRDALRYPTPLLDCWRSCCVAGLLHHPEAILIDCT